MLNKAALTYYFDVTEEGLIPPNAGPFQHASGGNGRLRWHDFYIEITCYKATHICLHMGKLVVNQPKSQPSFSSACVGKRGGGDRGATNSAICALADHESLLHKVRDL